ncbi:MAG: bifunctional 5,10-methylenetetrahydrofolate dehydrogenase/5,10-methenyltetrahydrofolate cyclohydrolase [Lachnospiraceae bacterium]|nr:bifunctional 5,10-methylenetetrahydrofolate dehydrogenase/5,10-methenyltetrahydrofolate cyclohydrolase [Lachnospiraceae bacterium]
MILKGVEVARAINERIAEEMKSFKGEAPKLAIIRVGEKGDDIAYERGAIKKMEKVNFRCQSNVYPEDITNEDFLKEFDAINNDDDVDGILLLKPLPKQIDEAEVLRRINPVKDLDGICEINMAKVYAGDETGYAPCTAEAVIEMLKYADVDLKGKRATVVGRSLVIGKPVSMLLMKANATVTICHTRTADMRAECKRAEILVAAAGVANMIDDSYVSDGTIVMDVGINVNEEGKLCGDVDFDKVEPKASIITPVPGGVGSVTTSVLALHLLKAAKIRRG